MESKAKLCFDKVPLTLHFGLQIPLFYTRELTTRHSLIDYSPNQFIYQTSQKRRTRRRISQTLVAHIICAPTLLTIKLQTCLSNPNSSDKCGIGVG